MNKETGLIREKSSYRSLMILSATIVSILFLVSVFVIVIDPMFHYHAPKLQDDAYLYTSFYQSPGEARHFQYDTAIVGTSMTENTRPSWFMEDGHKAIKLSYSGGRTADYAMLLDNVYKSGNEVSQIVMDLNDYQLSLPASERITTDPDYLNDDNYFTDVKYVFNKDVILAGFGRSIAAVSGASGNYDDAYTWDGEELFGPDKVLYDYDMAMAGVDRAFAVSHTDDDIEVKLTNVDECIANIIPYIEKHPETVFKIFFPPYSMGYWESIRESGDLDATIAMYGRAIEDLCEYENVDLYFFMDEYDTISDLTLYRDICHYRPEINRHIYEVMSSNSGENKDDIVERLARLKEYVEIENIVEKYRDFY